MKLLHYLAVAVLLISAFITGAVAQDIYPSKPIKIVAPAPPEGSSDLLARLIANKLQASMRQPVVVENKLSAATTIATGYVVKSPPDGYTLLIITASHTVNNFLFKNLPYDPIKDFKPVAFTHILPLIPTVNNSVPVKSANQLISWAKANPDEVCVATAGKGSLQQLALRCSKS